MSVIVAKFGGSSLSDAEQFLKVRKILLQNQDRKFVVPSAPGKRNSGDVKVTDLLYECHRLAAANKDINAPFAKVTERCQLIAANLSLDVGLDEKLSEIKRRIIEEKSAAYAASRGEYLCGLLLAKLLGWDFIDPAGLILFDHNGILDAEATQIACSHELMKHERAVIPGFYGSTFDGEIRTFSRGGSDVTGAVVARAADADLYENWTDVSGFLTADPRIVKNPKRIEQITYKELRELSYMGASVLHEDAIFPVRKAGIPINIRNTNEPGHPGTIIIPQAKGEPAAGITGIAGHKGFAVVAIEKAMMNAELGFGRRVLQAAEECGVSFEHLPTGIDTMCVVMPQEALRQVRERFIQRIIELTEPDSIEIHDEMALIATVGRGMVRQRGIASRLFNALFNAGVNIRMIDQGSSEMNIIIGVSNHEFETAVLAIYNTFIDESATPAHE
ncbi:MAG: aspartate kinase [Oscillospiraceae bacterium]|jgi:aspartate kinase|nr:aspartate kinase [Oscillospiraceae bacterium]